MSGMEWMRDRGRSWPSGAWTVFAVVFVLAAGVRIAWIPVAAISTGDAWMRTWLGRLWLEDPEWIDAGVWPPLHVYMLGSVLAFVPDMLAGGRILHVFAGSLAAVTAAGLAGELARDRSAALLAGLFVALAPLFVSASLEARPEAPTLALLFAAAWAVTRRRNGGGRSSVLLAGLAAAGATMLRYEAWLAVPVLALVLWRDRRALVLFLALALAFPLLWVWGNWRVFGDPLYFGHTAAFWALEIDDRARLPLEARLRDTLNLMQGAVRGLSVPLALAAVWTVWTAVWRPAWRPFAAIILVIAAFQTILSVNGSLHPKPHYTLLWTVPMLPLVAVRLQELASRWSVRVLTILLVVAGPVLALPGSLGVQGIFWRIGALPMVPRMEEKERLDELAEWLRQEQKAGEGLALDLFELGPPLLPRGYLLLALSPGLDEVVDLGLVEHEELGNRMVMAHFDRPRGTVDVLEFLERHPQGILMLREGSSLVRRHGLPAAGGRFALPEVCFDLEPLRIFEVPPRLGRLLFFRYRTCADGA